MPVDYTPDENSYFIDPENAAEMARLMKQDRLFTRGMGGLFPERSGDLTNINDILDIACGSGGWVLDVAHAYSKVQVTGIDMSKLMIKYARAQAKVQWLNNASFKVMNALKPLDFPDGSFDLVNARSIFGFMPTTAWPRLLQECMRIVRPGRVMRLTEFDTYGISNSPACEKINELGLRAFKLAGQSFSPDARSLGITPMLGRFLRNAGCINIRHMAHAIDYSAGTEAHAAMYENSMVVFKLSQPFLIKWGVATQEELDVLYDKALAEMMSDDFCGIWYYLTVYGTKP
jgi:ubiquinone/menaquinone biosynthesis C-methylase UbiE